MKPLEYLPELPEVAKRWEAWWNQQDIGRPAVWATAWDPKDNDPGPAPKEYASVRDRWLDLEHRVAQMDHWQRNTYFAGEAYPCAWPELGPEVFVGFMGAELEFTNESSWAVPLIESYDDMPRIAFDRQSPLWLAMEEFTERLLEVGKGKFITGHMDIHSGGDAVAALRDPQQMCLDLALYPDQVHSLMNQLRPLYTELYDHFHGMMLGAGQTGTTGWIQAYCEGKYTPVQIDFICMISTEMFREFLLDALVEECEFLDRSIYHLDGPDSLHHLDTLLEIEALDAIQWVPGSNTGPQYQWLPYLKRIQEAGKGLVLIDLYYEDDWEDDWFRTLRELDPRGVFIQLRPMPTTQAADEFVRKLEGLG